MTVEDIIAALRQEVTEDGYILLDKLEAELRVNFWPSEVFNVAVELFGPAMHNQRSKQRAALDRRIRHALGEWRRRYGPILNTEQEAYASSVLCAALRNAEEAWKGLGKPKVPPLIALAQNRIADMVNHERVHDGFKRRDGRVNRRAEVEAMLANPRAA